MNIAFGEALWRLRIEKGFSQQRLGDTLHVDRSTVAKLETGDRLPDAAMISLLSDQLGADVAELLHVSENSGEGLKVIMADDERIILQGGVPILEKAIPGAELSLFTSPAEAVAYARENRVALAFLDIEMGRVSGLDVCRELLTIHPRTNVIYLTAYREYSLDAWATGACGYLLKPLAVDVVREALTRLRYPLRGLGGVSG